MNSPIGGILSVEKNSANTFMDLNNYLKACNRMLCHATNEVKS